MEGLPILSLITLFPLLGFIVLIFFPKEKVGAVKLIAFLFALTSFVLSVLLWFNFSRTTSEIQFVEKFPWIPNLGINYHLGVDGLSLPLVFLTTLLTVLSLIYSWNIDFRTKEYFALFLLLETGMLGTFLALDYVLFYVFWEISLVPMYFLIGIWGGPRREYAAIKFFLYTLVGSLAMLVAILAIHFDVLANTGKSTFDILQIAAAKPFSAPAVQYLQSLCFIGFFLAFAIKVPLFPFHTWLPDAHVEAPTAGSVILAGVLLKMGAYGFLRISLPTFPIASHHFATIIAALAFISIVYGAFVALAQTDFKKMVAYSSVNHMGYVMLGIASACAVNKDTIPNATTALNGAVLQMFNHGIITGALFMLVGVIYERTHSRDLNGFGGLGAKVPLYAGVLILFSFGSLGLPGLAGFISEFLVFLGCFKIFSFLTVFSVIGVVITAAFFLWMIQRVLLGNLKEKYNNLTDMNAREIISLVPLALIMIYIGLYPVNLLNMINTSVQEILKALL